MNDDPVLLPFRPRSPRQIDLTELIDRAKEFADAIEDYDENVSGKEHGATRWRGRRQAPRNLRSAFDATWRLDCVFNSERAPLFERGELADRFAAGTRAHLIDAACRVRRTLDIFINTLCVPGICQDEAFIWVCAPNPDPQQIAPIFSRMETAPSTTWRGFFGWAPPIDLHTSKLNWLKHRIGQEFYRLGRNIDREWAAWFGIAYADRPNSLIGYAGAVDRIPNFTWPLLDQDYSSELQKSIAELSRKIETERPPEPPSDEPPNGKEAG
jgi:hypothetical protein